MLANTIAMKHWLLPLAAFALCSPVLAQEEAAPEAKPAPKPASKPAPGPSDIINAAPQSDWTVIAPEDLLVMTLAPDSAGEARRVIIQLMPAPFSQGWVSNIRTLARAEWYDGTSVNRVQDNYVVQWGDPNYDNPEAGGKAKPLPEGLRQPYESEYTLVQVEICNAGGCGGLVPGVSQYSVTDHYADAAGFTSGWPMAFEDHTAKTQRARSESPKVIWPVHCYGMVGVGRNYSPDTGTGAELYTVIGHAPRHLDRNIALVGRIIEGMEHLSSLPRGKGALGFYTKEEADKRTPILSIRVASDLPEGERPQFEYLSTETESFARYAEARANRRDPFFIVPAGGADICNIPVPIRRFEYTDKAAE